MSIIAGVGYEVALSDQNLESSARFRVSIVSNARRLGRRTPDTGWHLSRRPGLRPVGVVAWKVPQGGVPNGERHLGRG